MNQTKTYKFHKSEYRNLYTTYWYIEKSTRFFGYLIKSKQDINSTIDDEMWNSDNYFEDYSSALACTCDLTGV